MASSSGRGQRSSSRVARGIGKAAALLAKRLEAAVKVSADIEKRLSDFQARNAALKEEVKAADRTVARIEAERDQLKDQLLELAELIDGGIVGSLTRSAKIAEDLPDLTAVAPRPPADVPAAAPAPEPVPEAAATAQPEPELVPTAAPARSYPGPKKFFPLQWPDTGDAWMQ